MVDSTTVKVRDALIADVPGTGDDAARKVHTVLCVGCGAPVRYHCSPAREHDSPHLQIDEFWRGCGWLADLPMRVSRASGRAKTLRCASSFGCKTTCSPRSTTSPVDR
jgi:hypothetical protein